MNNQRQIGLAIIQYDMAKQHLPGYVNRISISPPATPPAIAAGWVPVLLPFLGRKDLWEGGTGVNGWRSGNPSASVCVRMNDLVCPDDPNATAPCPLSYVVNLGAYNAAPALPVVPPVSRPGLFRDYFTGVTSSGPTNTISLSSVKSPARTIMLGEAPFVAKGTGAGRDWTWVDGVNGAQTIPTSSWSPQAGSPFGFTWPEPDITQRNPQNDLTLDGTYLGVADGTLPPALPEIHAGIVNVTFCDGHSESLPDSTLCKGDTANTVFGMP